MPRQNMAPQAQRSPAMGCNNGCHVIDQAFLLAASRQTRQSSAPGVDQGTARQDAEPLDDNRRDRHERWRTKRYVAPPGERVGSEKDAGKRRPRGHPCVEDTMVQRAAVMLREALVEPELHGFSQGVSKGHRPQQARHEWREQGRTVPIAGIVEADVRGVFAHLDGGHRREVLQQRGKEGGIVRRLGKGLQAGVLESGARTSPAKGTPQGGGCSPRVSKGFLPRVWDAWVVKDGQPRMQGRCVLTRVAEEFIRGCEWEADARRVREVVPKRVARFRLTMPPEKTAVMAVKRPPRREPSAGGQGRVDCLGFPPYGAQTRRGDWVIKRKTVGKRRRRCRKEIGTGWREKRHAPLKEQDQP